MNKNITTDIKTILAEKRLDCDSERWQRRLDNISSEDVEKAISSPAGTYSLDKLTALISPAAEDYLEQMGLRVLRFTNEQVFNELNGVIDMIREALNNT